MHSTSRAQKPFIHTSLSPDANFQLAAIGGTIAALISSFIWAEFTMMLDQQYAFFSIIVGVIVGLAVRFAGRGNSLRYGMLAIGLMAVGVVLGSFLGSMSILLSDLHLNLETASRIFNLKFFTNLALANFQVHDMFFYGVSMFCAFFLALKDEVQ